MSDVPVITIAELPVRPVVQVIPAPSGRVVQVVAPINDSTAEAAAEVARQALAQALQSLVLSDIGGLQQALDALMPRAILQKNGPPAAADVPANTARVVKNTATGRISLWANDGGTMVDLLTFTTV
ncbi:MAG: hypothetical protein K2X54_27845 [Methylobacterium organophilum]|nr:hypothetical protein [Methylobacterium organophilum]